MCTASTTTCWDSSSMEVSLPMPTISSLATMSTEASNHLKLYASSWHTRSSIPRTSSCSEEITSALQSTESMDSMMNANAATTSSSGRLSLIASIAFLLLLLLMRKFYACMEDSAQSWAHSNKLRESWDPLMCPTLACFAISSGPIQTRTYKVGERMIVVSRSLLVRKLSQLLPRSTTSTLSAVLTKLSKMVMSSLPSVN